MPKNNHATKEDIKRLEKRIGKEVLDIKKEVLDMKVEVLSELKAMRDESAAHQFAHQRIDDELLEHDKRLKALGPA